FDAPKNFIEHVHKFNLTNGATFILHDQFNNIATLNICSSYPETFLNPSVIGMLQMALINFHQEISSFKPGDLALPDQNIKSLTYRERQVLHLIKNGLKYREISQLLNISIETIKYHRRNILVKLNVDNTKRAILIASDNKLL
ncbi:response regulator transcription factor, partial [Pantoea endophytica]